jgi:hypothetical protein
VALHQRGVDAAVADACRFIFAYGELIYRLLGEGAEASFARSWGVSYGVGTASEFSDVAQEAAKAVALMALLESLYLTRNIAWLEARSGPLRRPRAPTRGRCVARLAATEMPSLSLTPALCCRAATRSL